jgi:ribosomal protein L7/L12
MTNNKFIDINPVDHPVGTKLKVQYRGLSERYEVTITDWPGITGKVVKFSNLHIGMSGVLRLDQIEVLEVIQKAQEASLGDILSLALEARRGSEVEDPKKEIDTLLGDVPRYFKETRRLDSSINIERIKRYRELHQCSLTEAKLKVEVMMLIEMLNEAVDMTDVRTIRQWAMNRLYVPLAV